MAQTGNLNLPTKTIKGLLPSVDRRVLDTPFVLQGRNFYVDLEGPRAGFGSVLISYKPIKDPYFAKTFRVADRIVLATQDALLEYDTASQDYYPIYTFDGSAGTGPWSYAIIGTRYYFCRKGVGVIEYNSSTEVFTLLSSFVPTNPTAVVQTYGRLVILGTETYAWSALDDGSNLTPSLVTGAGFQSLSIIGGAPLAVKETEVGFLVYTERGVVIAEKTSTQAVFRHRVLSRSHRPVNAFCIVDLEDYSHIILDKKGFFRTSGKGFEPFQPLFSEFVVKTLLRNADLSEPTAFALSYNEDRKFIFLSLGISGTPGKYSKAYCIYLPRDEWGSFDRIHHGFGELSLADGPYKGFNFGYICPDGWLHKFVNIPYHEPGAMPSGIYYWSETPEYPARKQGDNWHMPTVLDVIDTAEAEFDGLPDGLYGYTTSGPITNAIAAYVSGGGSLTDLPAVVQAWNTTSADTLAPHVRVQSPLLAEIEVGLYRYTQQQFDDEMSIVTDVSIGMSVSDDEYEDWLIEPEETVDYETSTADDEDWGFDAIAGYTYSAEIKGSNDGRTVFNEEELQLARVDGETKFFVCFNNAIFHSIILGASEAGQSFHLKSLELTGNLSGRLRG